jgi:hypothetical protein
MKLLRVTVLLLSLVAFAFSTPSHAAASGSATVFNLHQLAALADFDSFSPDGCVETFVFVAGLQNNGVPEAFGFIGQVDSCTGASLSAAGETLNTTFQINNQLTSASLSATIPLFDEVSGNTFNVSVNATWTGTGPLTREIGSSHFHTKNFIENFHFNDNFRDASASGTVSDGVTNFTPSPSVGFTQMASFKNGDVTISH